MKARVSSGTGGPQKGAALQEDLRYRRSADLVLYWEDGDLIFENYAQQTRISAEPLTCSLLGYCAESRSFAEICSFLDEFSESSILDSLTQLCANRILEALAPKTTDHSHAMQSWAGWNPAAGFFHFSTKDFPFAEDPVEATAELKKLARREPMPLPLKRYPHARKTKLPNGKTTGDFPDVLKARRTWRIYGRKPVPLESLAQTLQLAFGIQGWAKIPGLGRVAMKTSPSCGCLHPIEAYVLANNVQGLRRGLYHYNAEHHELERLRGGLPKKVLEKNLGHQWWFAKSGFLVLMTAVFARTQWKYKFPRVYRGILLEAGHLCQTFCLAATWKGLAPFSTIAYMDKQWEKWLGIDGINESLLYIAGAGTRPANLKDAHIGVLQEHR